MATLSNGIALIQTPSYMKKFEKMNNFVPKMLQMGHANNKDNRTEVQKCILMQNVTTHGATGKSSPQEAIEVIKFHL